MSSNNKETSSNVRLSVEQFDHAALVVRDVSASVKWYRDWLGFDSLSSGQNALPHYVGNGITKLALLPASDSEKFTFTVNQGVRACHLAFQTSRGSFNEYERRLTGEGIEYEKLTHSDSQSLYFSDPDGYLIEVVTYERVRANHD